MTLTLTYITMYHLKEYVLVKKLKFIARFDEKFLIKFSKCHQEINRMCM